MTLTQELRAKVAKALVANRSNFEGSDAKYAASFGINKSVYARIKAGETERVMKDPHWISCARRLGVQLGDEPEWMPAETAVFQYISQQLFICQAESISGIYCDYADIGKTFTAKQYVKTHKNAVYVDCSQVKTKHKLIRFIAKEFGLDSDGKYADVFEDLAYYLRIVSKPLVILDEGGDLDYPAFLELKALWNAAEGHCAWYMMGANGLEKKLDKGITNKKVGYTEMFSRYGTKYQHIVPLVKDEREAFILDEQAAIIAANMPDGVNIQQLVLKANHSHRSLRHQILKMKRLAA